CRCVWVACKLDSASLSDRLSASTVSSLHATQTHLHQQQALLGAKQEQNQLLTDQLKNQTDLHQRVYELLNATDKVRLSKKLDVAALEAMPEGDLQSLVTNLEQDLDKMVRFVNDQEEELQLQQDDIDALKAKLDSVSDYDRLQLETEIAEEKDRHVMLNRTLVGQRRNLLEREEVLSQHRAVLLRRQGLAAAGTGAAADLEPVLDEIDELRAALGEQIQQVENEIAELQSEIDSLKKSRQEQQQQLEDKQQSINDSDSNYSARQQQLGEGRGQVALYETLLAPMEERVASFSQSLDAISAMIAEVQSAEAQQQSAITNAQQVLQSVASPEPALV
ncbi:MAG: pilus motility taxis protein HmpF, partial [Cyanobacteria bacterium J06576_12]